MQKNSNKQVPALWVILGASLTVCCWSLYRLSHRFVYGSDMAARPIPLLIQLLMGMAVVYLIAVALVRLTPPSKKMLVWILFAGIAMRLLFLPGLPMLEDDYYRYLWDGAVTASGQNPYAYIPEQVEQGAADVPEDLVVLGQESELMLERINHPKLTTCYPPIAQGVFALAYIVKPWSLVALKIVYFCFDAITAFFLLKLLGVLNRSSLWLVVYWWNPLLIKEIYNSGHMDVIILPFAAGALYCSMRDKPVRATVLLALGVGAKLWPILLAPLILWPVRRDPKRMALAITLFVLVLGALFVVPVSTALDQGDTSGFVAYGQRWEMNDALFMVFPWVTEQVTGWMNITLTDRQLHRAGQLIGMIIVCTLLAWYTFKKSDVFAGRAAGAMAVVAALFLVSPTQFPWYYCWLVPFLCIRPRVSLLLLTLMLPLYYLKFYYAARDQVDYFHNTIVWFEYAPVWIALIIEALLVWWKGKKCNRVAPSRRSLVGG